MQGTCKVMFTVNNESALTTDLLKGMIKSQDLCWGEWDSSRSTNIRGGWGQNASDHKLKPHGACCCI